MTSADAILERTLATIDAAFADTPRPADEELLHERCFDHSDVRALYPVAHWHELPDEVVETEYAALSFLSPAGFRHYIPAYMGFALRRLGSGAAAVDSTIWSLAPDFYDDPDLRDFVNSKLAALDADQAAAVVAFLMAVVELGDESERADATKALRHWRERG